MSKKSWEYISLIIIGEPRSGTTLVSNFLNSQTNCIVYSDLLKAWFREYQKLGLESILSPLTDRQKNVLLTNLVAEGWKFGISTYDQIDRNSFNTSLELIKHAFTNLDETNSAQVIGTKMTQHYVYLNELLENNLKIIFCVRDPRDVLLSAKNRFSDYNLFQRALFWKESVNIIKKYEGNAGVYLLRFEDLLNEEKRSSEIDRLSRFLQIELNPNPETIIIRDGMRFVSNSSFGDVNRMFDEKALYRWKSDTSAPEVVFASKYLSKEIAYLDYPNIDVPKKQYRKIYKQYIKYSFIAGIRNLVQKIFGRLIRP